MRLTDWLVLFIIAVLMAAAILFIWKHRDSGCGGCSDCARRENCKKTKRRKRGG